MNTSVPTKSVINGYSRENDYTYAVASCSSLSSSWHSGSTYNTSTNRSFSNACNTADGYISKRKTQSFSLTIINATDSPGSASTSIYGFGWGITNVSPTSGSSGDISWSASYSGSTLYISASGPNGTVSSNVQVTYYNDRTFKGTSSTSVSGTITGMSFVSGDAGSASYSGSTATVTWSGLSTSGTRSATYRINYRYTTSGYYTYYGSDTVRIPTGLTNANLTSCSRVSGTSATVSRVNSTHARCNWSGLSSSSASTNCRLNYSYDSPIYEDRADVTYIDSNGQSHEVDYVNFNGNVYP